MKSLLSKGIDVSHHNGVIDWKKVKQSGEVDFALIRAGYGQVITQKDKQFENNYKGCKDNNIPVGVYWYSYAKSVKDAIEEAKICLEIIKDKQFEYPILFDIEEKSQMALGKDICSEICIAFCSYLEEHGYFAGVYTFDSFANTSITDNVKNRYTMAIARLGSEPKYSCYDIWQYSWTGKVDGISGDVDLDYCYKDYSIIKQNYLNGFKKITEPSVQIVAGDMDGDGKVTSYDALKILQKIVE